MTPEYRNRKILEHCNNKKSEYLSYKLSILDDTFDILIHEFDNYINEYYTAYLSAAKKLNIDPDEIKDSNSIKNWIDQTDNALIDNANRKNKLRINFSNQKSEKKINTLTNQTISYYLEGFEIVNTWSKSFHNDYQEFRQTMELYERTVQALCITNDNLSPQDLIKSIEVGLHEKLSKSFPNYTILMIDRLTQYAIAD